MLLAALNAARLPTITKKSAPVNRTRITIEKHVENDPTFQCRNYLENVDYSKCLQERYIGEVFLLLGCIPPWLGGKEEIWCNSTLQNINGKIQHLEDILTNRYTDTECKYLIISKKELH